MLKRLSKPRDVASARHLERGDRRGDVCLDVTVAVPLTTWLWSSFNCLLATAHRSKAAAGVALFKGCPVDLLSFTQGGPSLLRAVTPLPPSCVHLTGRAFGDSNRSSPARKSEAARAERSPALGMQVSQLLVLGGQLTLEEGGRFLKGALQLLPSSGLSIPKSPHLRHGFNQLACKPQCS